VILDESDPRAIAIVLAIQAGDLDTLCRLLREHPGLAAARIRKLCKGTEEQRSLLHVATDWPGHFPGVADTIAELVRAGADLNAHFVGPHAETPLHWAASSNDLEALDALLDLGADIEANGSHFADGPPMADAVAFGQWRAAWRLLERGARTNLCQAAALGRIDRVQEHLARQPACSREDVTKAFWAACHGGQQATAELLLGHGADLDWVGYDHLTPLDIARRSGPDGLIVWLLSKGAKSASK
jgi:ankyrin repeat protein